MPLAPALSTYADLEQILAALDSNEAAAHHVVDGLCDAELHRQSDNGRGWSILQCILHLALANSVYTAAMRAVVRDPKSAAFPRTGPIRPSALGALFLKRLEPPVTSKAPAPRLIVPPPGKSKAEVFSAFHRSHDDIRTVMRDAWNLDINRLRFRNPLLPILRVRVGTGLLIMPAHERRHLWQARQIREAAAK